MIPYKDALLNHLNRLAKATSSEQFEKRLNDLEKSDVWSDSYGKVFRTWFESTWLAVKEVRTLFIYLFIIATVQPLSSCGEKTLVDAGHVIC
jgi:hypothetical protein